MYQVWSTSIEGCWFWSVYKDVTQYKFDLVILTFDLWPWKSLGFQILLRTKYVPSLVKFHRSMSILECSQGCYRRKDGIITISFRNFVGEGIKMPKSYILFWKQTYNVMSLQWYLCHQDVKIHFTDFFQTIVISYLKKIILRYC